MNNRTPIEWIRKRWIIFVPVVAVVILAAVILVPALARSNDPIDYTYNQPNASADSWAAQAEKEAVAYYREKYGDANVTARAVNYGCHVQIDILKDGKVVKSLSYFGSGQFYELN